MEDDVIEELNDGIEGEVLDFNTSSFTNGSPKPKKTLKEKTSNTVENSGNVVQGTGKAVETAGTAVNAAGKGMEAAGKTAEAAGKAVEVAGKGAQAAGDAISAGGQALSAIPYVGTALGGIANAAGKGVKAAGKGAEVAGKGTQKAGKAVNNAGKKTQDTAKGIKKTGNKINNKGKQISDTGSRIKGSSKKGRISNNPLGSKLESNTDASNFTDKAKNFIKKRRESAKQELQSISSTASGNIGFSGKIKKFGKLLKLYVLLGLLYIVLTVILIYIIFSPILDAIQWLDDNWDSISTTAEKTGNFYSGFGCQDSKEAFFEELNYLYGEYDEQLDVPLIMATLFYKEREGYDTKYSINPVNDTGDLDELNTQTLAKEAASFLKSKYKDMYETLDTDGKNYTIGKIYRLRKLARNQLDTSLFGNGGLPTEEEEVSLSEFLERVQDRMGDDLYQLFQAIPSSLTGFPDFFKKVYELLSIADGSETLATTSFGNWSETSTALTKLLKESILTGLEFGNLHYADGEFKVTIYKYDYNEDNYKKYLKDYYIPTMPEFSEDVGGLTGTAKENEIDRIINDIYEYSDEFKDIYGYVQIGSAEEYDEECVGNVPDAVVSSLTQPVKSTSFNFSGSSAYGISDGVTNNGVDLTSSSAGVKDGDNVYAVAAGKVTEVVSNINCNTASDASCSSLGNYIKIQHEIRTDGKTYKILSIYTNLKAGSISLKKGKSVKKGDVIAKVGNTGDASEAQLHFELHDLSDGDTALNPTNLFIECTISSGELVGNSNEEKIWFYLTRIAKFSKVQAAGVLGNLQSESGFEPQIVQGDTPISEVSYNYTKKVDKKTISKTDFIKHGPGGGGYGLAQWTTYGRKELLYNKHSKKKTSIGDLEMQLEFLVEEMNGNPGQWLTMSRKKEWFNAKTPYESGMLYCRYFERPADLYQPSRGEQAKAIYKKYKDKKYESNISMDNIASNEGETKAKNWSNEKKIDYLFPNGVPKSESELKKYLVDVTVPITTKSGKKTTTKVTIHKAIAGDLKAALQAAQDEGFAVYEVGGYRTFGTDEAGKVKSVGLVYSQHCYGLAVDINVNENCYKSPANAPCSVGKLYSTSNKYSIKKSGALYKSFINNGWGWGGEWSSLKDYMHFSFFGV